MGGKSSEATDFKGEVDVLRRLASFKAAPWQSFKVESRIYFLLSSCSSRFFPKANVTSKYHRKQHTECCTNFSCRCLDTSSWKVMYNKDVYTQALRCKCFAINSRLKNKSTRSTRTGKRRERSLWKTNLYQSIFSWVNATPCFPARFLLSWAILGGRLCVRIILGSFRFFSS